MSNRWETQRREVTWAAMEMAKRGLVSGSSGNVSVRLSPQDATNPLIAVTPSGKPYSDLEEADIVVVDQDGEPVEGDGVPSSETLLHLALYRSRPDIAAVVHTHSLFASVAAVAGMEIPPILDEMATTLGGPVRVSEYGFPGSAELADKVALALGDRAAALIRNHGAVGVGGSAQEALEVCTLLERAAQIFIYTSLLGRATPVPQDSIEAEQSIYRMTHGLPG